VGYSLNGKNSFVSVWEKGRREKTHLSQSVVMSH